MKTPWKLRDTHQQVSAYRRLVGTRCPVHATYHQQGRGRDLAIVVGKPKQKRRGNRTFHNCCKLLKLILPNLTKPNLEIMVKSGLPNSCGGLSRHHCSPLTKG